MRKHMSIMDNCYDWLGCSISDANREMVKRAKTSGKHQELLDYISELLCNITWATSIRAVEILDGLDEAEPEHITVRLTYDRADRDMVASSGIELYKLDRANIKDDS